MISGAILWVTHRYVGKEKRVPLLVLLVGMAALGIAVGALSGLSRVSAVGDVMSASIALFAAAAAYLYSKDPEQGASVSLCAISYSFGLLLGYLGGAGDRAMTERYSYWRTTCLTAFSNPELVGNASAFQEFSLRTGNICGAILTSEEVQLGLRLEGQAPPH